jgi:hypothetical protein
VSRDIRTIVELSYASGQRRTGDVRGFLAIPERGAPLLGILTRPAKTPKRFQEVLLASVTWGRHADGIPEHMDQVRRTEWAREP